MCIDYYTFSGRGEPTLARNLGEMIRALRARGKGKVAVITNAALIHRKDVRRDLALADFVLVKLDACNQKTLTQVDVPAAGIDFKKIIKGIKAFRKEFSGKLALQVMFIEQNQRHAAAIARIAREIKPDEVQINTPLRPCAVKALGREEMDGIKKYFKGLPVVSVYDAERKNIRPLDEKETIRRHGNYRKKYN
jgi:wyosine [tRNA(Phe)-imidazoG37] synthetase (radical SAM superfamily)